MCNINNKNDIEEDNMIVIYICPIILLVEIYDVIMYQIHQNIKLLHIKEKNIF